MCLLLLVVAAAAAAAASTVAVGLRCPTLLLELPSLPWLASQVIVNSL